jgi:hypothetical protein
MISYMKQVSLCDSVRETIKRAFTQTADLSLRMKTGNIPSTDSILRAISISPRIEDEQTLKQAIVEHTLNALRLTEDQKADIRSALA